VCSHDFDSLIDQNRCMAHKVPDHDVCNGILFNHESPRRGENFVTRKITMAVARIKFGMQECLALGNSSAQRDWGHARDYVRYMWLVLQRDMPDDCVVATGFTTTVRRFRELAFEGAGMTVEFKGEGVDEIGVVASKGQPLHGKTVVKVEPRYFHPDEVELLLGDPSKARKELGWDPSSCSLPDLVKEMVDADLRWPVTRRLTSSSDQHISWYVVRRATFNLSVVVPPKKSTFSLCNVFKNRLEIYGQRRSMLARGRKHTANHLRVFND